MLVIIYNNLVRTIELFVLLLFPSALPASPTWNYRVRTSPSTPLIHSKQSQTPTIFVNGMPYVVIRLIGEGLHSRVYAAYDPRLKQSVAIKVVQNIDPIDSREHTKMFFKEIRYLTKLQSRNPYVIRVYNHEYDSKIQTGKIVMETGHDFRFMLPLQASSKEKQMTPGQARYYWSQMAQAVAMLHQNGIVHSGRKIIIRSHYFTIDLPFFPCIDIKPENFIMTPDGKLRIIDLGLSFRISHTETSVLRPFAGGHI